VSGKSRGAASAAGRGPDSTRRGILIRMGVLRAQVSV